MIALAWDNLSQNRIRFVISVGGAALALLLILILDAIFAGVEQRLTVYIDNSGADIFVAQEDVRNMHMASSTLPDIVTRKVRAIPGVAAVSPIHYLSSMVVVGADRQLAYVIGLPENAAFGGPWNLAQGKSQPGKREAVIDRNVAEQAGIALGDTVEILGEDFEVAGLSEETSSLVNSVVFISARDLEELRSDFATFSFLLVRVDPLTSPEIVVARIEESVRDVTAQTRSEFATQERRVVNDMSTDVVSMMNLIGFLIGLAVIALTVYTSTLARLAEYGVLKALGASVGHLYQTVISQSLISVALGYAVALLITTALVAIVPRLGLSMVLQVRPGSLIKVGGMSLAIAGAAAALPIRAVAGLDPAVVFRGSQA